MPLSETLNPSLLERRAPSDMCSNVVPDDDSFVHVDVDEVRAGAAVGLPVGFGVLVGQFVGSMVIGRDLHLLPALVLLQLHAGT